MSQTIPNVGGVTAGILAAITLWYRIAVTVGSTFTLDVAAAIITGAIVISSVIGVGVYASLGGRELFEHNDPDVIDE